ncbi:MAG: hypothetical protein LBT12_06725 [Oscillospiraceae bacterium]|nr:hypothetical protein [Oscillospiraceae bacterium]
MPFFGDSGKLCAACFDRMEKDLMTVRDFVRAHPDEGSVPEISEKTGVPQSAILHLLKENRLSTTAEDSTLCCEVCRQPIRTGRFCEKCKNILVEQIDKVTATPEPEPQQSDAGLRKLRQSKMHINRED